MLRCDQTEVFGLQGYGCDHRLTKNKNLLVISVKKIKGGQSRTRLFSVNAWSKKIEKEDDALSMLRH